MMLTMLMNESELKAKLNLEMLLVHVRVRDAGQRHKRLLHSLKYFRRIFFMFTRFAFLQSKICILQSKICSCAKQDLYFCKTRFAFATHLWTCPLEHVVRSSSLVVGSGQAAMFKHYFCNSFVWICFFSRCCFILFYNASTVLHQRAVVQPLSLSTCRSHL